MIKMENELNVNQQEQMLKGTAWLTAGNFISRLLGAIYIIPWYAWMGKYAPEANALFGMGYEIYALFLLVSTVGIPVAVAKQVSKYNTLGHPEMSTYLIRKVFGFMLILGAIFAVIMYFGSPFFAFLSRGGKDLVPILKSLTLAVLIFPCMSALRGFFQGFNNLKPYAISQVAEQIIRVIWMLVTTFFIMKLGSKNYVEAVTQSTFAAFIGMFASLSVLFYFLWKYRLLGNIFASKLKDVKVETTVLILETVKEAIPFIVTGSAVQLFKLIDQFTFGNTMALFTRYSDAELKVMFAYFSSNPGKVTMILIAVATAIAGVGIPLLTENFVKRDRQAAARLIVNNIQMLLIFMIPAVIGSVLLAKPLYTVFYNLPDKLALGLFIASLLQTLILALYTILAPMLQALFENKKAILYFGYGILVKLILQFPMIYLFKAYGPILSTSLALLVPIILMFKEIHQITGFNRKMIYRTAIQVLILSTVMTILSSLVLFILRFILPNINRLTSIVYLILVGVVAITVYGSLGLITRVLDKLFGDKAKQLRKKLHLERL